MPARPGRLRPRRHLWTSAYAVVTYPTPAQLATYGGAGPRPRAGLPGQLFNTGWAQARQNLAVMRAAGLQPPTIWVDVEPVRPPAPWSSDTTANRAVLEGSIAAYRRAGLQVGVYSTPYLWRTVVGDVDYGFPEWRAAGLTSRQRALEVCAGEDVQGGRRRDRPVDRRRRRLRRAVPRHPEPAGAPGALHAVLTPATTGDNRRQVGSKSVPSGAGDRGSHPDRGGPHDHVAHRPATDRHPRDERRPTPCSAAS